ncbi:EF-hand domain-containing protein [Sphingobium sp. DEHP117]|uniref:EF-hand domain-containing protein n=1 Tax=Sphingobium sp. DEHP117 TaxID=2993436 RepID=UPI0027D74AC6|nr:EF-hand domain-containing protein [Sphingobium sp. DEHP117]MDQ4419024.1 EF-hand domain-containing protein [Sphingobium sp. DEHP117]
MKKTLLIAGGAALALAIPAIAISQSGAMPMMKPDMTRAQMEAMVKDHFAKADANKDGALTKEEAKASMDERRADRLEDHFKAMDSNGDGSISRDEFFAGHRGGRGPMAQGHGDHDAGKSPAGHMGHGMKGMGMKMGDRMFDKADANNDGKVTQAEATSAATSHFDAMDADKNGTVTAGERMDYMKAKMKDWRAAKGDKS